MRHIEVLVTNPSGLHARPASELARLVKTYKSEVYIEFNGKKLLAKSPLSIMSGCIECGSLVRIVADGPDEDECLKAVEEYIKELKE